MQVAMMTIIMSNTSNILLNLVDALNTSLATEEEEEGSSS